MQDTGTMLYQLSYEATRWERGQFVEFISSRQYHYVPIRGSLRVVGLLEGGLYLWIEIIRHQIMMGT